MSTAMRRRYGAGDLAAITAMIDHARDRQRWDKMVFWSKVLCRNRMYAVGLRAPDAASRGAWEETAYDEAKAGRARRRAGG